MLDTEQATGKTKTPYKAIGENPSKYIHSDYLPPNRRSAFLIQKPNEMDLDDMRDWIEYLYSRQELKADNKLSGPIFAFKKQARTVGRKKGRTARGSKKMSDSEGATSDGEEFEIEVAMAMGDESEGELRGDPADDGGDQAESQRNGETQEKGSGKRRVQEKGSGKRRAQEKGSGKRRGDPGQRMEGNTDKDGELRGDQADDGGDQAESQRSGGTQEKRLGKGRAKKIRNIQYKLRSTKQM